SDDTHVAGGAELVVFTEAAHRLDDSLPAAREALTVAVGVDGTTEAAVTASIFRSLNIAADSSGIRIDSMWEDTAKQLMTDLGTGQFRTAANSPALG
ncbi:MAG: hypothetical protein ACC660_08785, partial [Acidimicrobiales bacterium]